MKRFAILALMAAFIMSSAVVSAADLKVSGSWRVVGDITNFEKDGKSIDEDHFRLRSRARTTFEFVANEHLKAVTQLEFFKKTWGQNGAQTGDKQTVKARTAYIAFDVPDSAINIQAGFQNFATPSATGWWSPFDENAAGIVVAMPLNDMVGLNVAWFRTKDESADNGINIHDEADMLYADVAVKTDAFEVTPWILYERSGKNADNANTFFLAASGSVNMLDPLTLAGDLYFGSSKPIKGDDNKSSAFGMVVSASYAMDMFTPEAYVGYFTGAKNDNLGMPALAGDIYKTTFFFDGSSLGAGNVATKLIKNATGVAKAKKPSIDPIDPGLLDGPSEPIDKDKPIEKGKKEKDPWTDNGLELATQSVFLGIGLKDISLVDRIKHSVNLVYLKGTSDKVGFDKDCSAFSVDFNTKYQVYEQLAAIAEIGYAKVDTDGADSSAFGLSFGIKYDF